MIDLARLDALVALSRSLEATLEVEPETPALREISYREIRVSREGQRFLVPCFDEFRDVELGTPVILLHLVLDACICFEEADDYGAWLADLGLRDDERARSIYSQLASVVPAVRALVGPDAQPINSHDLEFNTGLAKALRAHREPGD